jgi:hypothetical protein
LSFASALDGSISTALRKRASRQRALEDDAQERIGL